MRVITDKSFNGEEGMVRVWNQTDGYVALTAEGHLLNSHQAAWVDDNPVVQNLIEIGHVLVMAGTSKKSAKKNGKTRTKVQSHQENDTSQGLPVAQTQKVEENVGEINETQIEPKIEDVEDQSESLVLDSSQILDNIDSVSVENI